MQERIEDLGAKDKTESHKGQGQVTTLKQP